jgi:hypothetical protein
MVAFQQRPSGGSEPVRCCGLVRQQALGQALDLSVSICRGLIHINLSSGKDFHNI